MIEFIQGRLVSKFSDRLVIQTGGIGFSVTVSALTLNQTPEAGEEITLFPTPRLLWSSRIRKLSSCA